MSQLKVDAIRHTSATVDALTFDSSGNTKIADNEELQIGSGSDLKIYHSGSNSHIKDSGTGHLQIDGSRIQLRNVANDDPMVDCTGGGTVELFHNGTKVAETSSTGFDIAANKGITFGNAASNGISGTSSLFDDYEEGIYNPTWSQVTNTSNYNDFFYTKIGNMVTVQGWFKCATTTNQDAGLQMSLPIAIASNPTNGYSATCFAPMHKHVDTSGNDGNFIGYCSNGSETVQWYSCADDSDWSIRKSHHIAVDDEMVISFTYRCN